MTRVRFRIEAAEGSWAGDVSRAFPETTLRIDGMTTDGDTGFVLIAVDGPRRDAVVEALRAHDAVDDADVTATEGRETTLYVAGDAPRFVTAARRSELPIDPPVTIANGNGSLTVVGDRDRLSLLTERFTDVGIRFDIERVGHGGGESTRVLTDTQRELVTEALDAGYYDTPRTCTLTELAERMGIAKSTCSETLQRAEEQLIKRSADRITDADASTTADEPEAITR